MQLRVGSWQNGYVHAHFLPVLDLGKIELGVDRIIVK